MLAVWSNVLAAMQKENSNSLIIHRLIAHLPSSDLIRHNPNQPTKVTISLSSENVAYFKQAAKQNHMQYQKMI